MSPLRAVLVGAGGMGRAWAREIASDPDLSLTGWVDLFPDRVAEGIEAAGLTDVAVEESIEPALAKLSPDFVVDVAVPEAHHDITRRCLEQGVPVLGEKPMAANLDQARDLVQLSERTSTLFVVSQNRRYNTGLAAFKSLVEQHLGGIGQLNAEFYRAPHFGGFRDEMDSPLLVDMAIHTFDAARYIAGSGPVSVHCTEFNPPWSWYRGAASAVAEFEFEGGIRFSYQGSWCAEGLQTSWESSWRAIGAVGSATWDGSSRPVAEVRKPGSSPGEFERVEAAPVTVSGLGIAGSLTDFVKALRTGEVPMNECHDNIKSFAMVMAALESSRSGRRVAVEA
ncbi:MAG TPA: Gfo/Idh/MocA family oxidoreductase [Acidimicrobiales bacterium]|nr:Gfo/Idh/MocA family oxidoreductase [Acidimicrobiales bacterium]